MKTQTWLILVVLILIAATGCTSPLGGSKGMILASGVRVASTNYTCCLEQYHNHGMTYEESRKLVSQEDCCSFTPDPVACEACVANKTMVASQYKEKQNNLGALEFLFLLFFYSNPVMALLLSINLIVWSIRKKGFLPRWLWITLLVIVLLGFLILPTLIWLVLMPLMVLLLVANLIVWLIRKKGFLPRWLWITMLIIVILYIGSMVLLYLYMSPRILY